PPWPGGTAASWTPTTSAPSPGCAVCSRRRAGAARPSTTPPTAGWCSPSGADQPVDSRPARRYGPRVPRSHLRLSKPPARRSRGLALVAAVLTCVALGTTACGGSSSAAPAAATGSGPVDVLYAGSLVSLMEKQVGPGFGTATGYSFSGFSGGSTALAAQIKGKVRAAGVFVSA